MHNLKSILNKLGLTNKQIELLLLVLPYPFGKGMRKKEAQQFLNLSESALFSRLRNIKKNKKVWKPLKRIIELAEDDRDKIENAQRIGCMDWTDSIYRMGYLDWKDHIRQKF